MHSFNDWLEDEEALTRHRQDVYRQVYGGAMTDKKSPPQPSKTDKHSPAPGETSQIPKQPPKK